MFVGAARVIVMVKESHSLKQKRAVIRRVKARVKDRFDVAIAEVGAQDSWQRGELGWAMATSDHSWAERALSEVAHFIGREDGLEVIDVQRHIAPFDGVPFTLDPRALARALDRTGAGDKAVAVAEHAEADFVPTAWREPASDPLGDPEEDS